MGNALPKLRYANRALMFFSATFGIGLGMVSRNKQKPILAVFGAPVDLVLSCNCVIWIVMALVFALFTWHNVRRIENPRCWAMITLLVAGTTTYYFKAIGFDPMDWYFWGPIATELGIIITAGFERIYHSAERGFLRRGVDYIMGNGTGDENGAANGAAVPLQPLRPVHLPEPTV